MNALNLPTLVASQTLENSCFNYLSLISSLPNFERSVASDVTRISADAPVVYFNAAIKPNFNGNVDQTIEETRDYFLDQGRSSFIWFVTPSSQPCDLSRHLSAHGADLLEELPYMFLRIDEMQRDLPEQPDFYTRQVRTHEMLYNWTSIYCQSRSYSQATNQVFDVLFDLSLEDDAPLQLLLGYVDETPVATYSVFLDREIAGLYSLSTLPEARGKGIGTSISIAAADVAREYGYDSLTLLSEPMSRNLCKRLGFVEGFGMMELYRMSL